MRLWSLHPRYLDAAGLVACWRESLLAQKALSGATTGYRHHPQLDRFRAHERAIATYLHGLAEEADARAYRFDRTRIVGSPDAGLRLPVTAGQLAYERDHLLAKLRARSPEHAARLENDLDVRPHPLFSVIGGGIEPWERTIDHHGPGSTTDHARPASASSPRSHHDHEERP
ncbi:pyrimidine dimer DNA glycosylase/endonuclease V [Planctomonas sp. JC2975]|uniref:pyrimidine dimer DNA glycosylase/endonuclease V n=1 Tax=Planctomonas sp. JC2975 TaxID=2729626 RepID=UPI001F10D416|nr:pyrimidine dimer DNA glycosylase/endonuclease V [Planctomonas sp. JC2975]